MLLIKTYLDKSPIHGFGVFAADFIPKDTVIWKFVSGFDTRINEAEYQELVKLNPVFCETYFFKSSVSGYYICGLDNDRFTNHSDHPNCDVIELDGEIAAIANKNIIPGEEITNNYDWF